MLTGDLTIIKKSSLPFLLGDCTTKRSVFHLSFMYRDGRHLLSQCLAVASLCYLVFFFFYTCHASLQVHIRWICSMRRQWTTRKLQEEWQRFISSLWGPVEVVIRGSRSSIALYSAIHNIAAQLDIIQKGQPLANLVPLRTRTVLRATLRRHFSSSSSGFINFFFWRYRI